MDPFGLRLVLNADSWLLLSETFGIRDLAADHPRVSNYVIGRARETGRGWGDFGSRLQRVMVLKGTVLPDLAPALQGKQAGKCRVLGTKERF